MQLTWTSPVLNAPIHVCLCACAHVYLSHVHVCISTTIFKVQTVPSPRALSHPTFIASPTPLPSALSLTPGVYSSVLWLYNFILRILYELKYMMYNLLRLSFPLTVILLRSIQVTGYFNGLFLFIAEFCSMVEVFHPLFNHSSHEGYVGCF